MRLPFLAMICAASLVFVSLSGSEERGGTTLVTPPWTHCLGLHKANQFHLDIYSGYREKFDDPEGLFCIKLARKDKPDTRRDDDELTVFGVNSGAGDIIYNKSLVSIGIVGEPGEGPMRFRNPLSLTGDKDGNLYVADTGNDRVAHLRYADDGLVWVKEIRGGTLGGLRSPSGVCLSGGRLLVADTENDRVVVFDPDGSVVESFGAEFQGAYLFRPYAIAAITAGDEFLYYGDHFIILTDSLGMRLWKLSPDGKALGLVRRRRDRRKRILQSRRHRLLWQRIRHGSRGVRHPQVRPAPLIYRRDRGPGFGRGSSFRRTARDLDIPPFRTDIRLGAFRRPVFLDRRRRSPLLRRESRFRSRSRAMQRRRLVPAYRMLGDLPRAEGRGRKNAIHDHPDVHASSGHVFEADRSRLSGRRGACKMQIEARPRRLADVLGPRIPDRRKGQPHPRSARFRTAPRRFPVNGSVGSLIAHWIIRLFQKQHTRALCKAGHQRCFPNVSFDSCREAP